MQNGMNMLKVLKILVETGNINNLYAEKLADFKRIAPHYGTGRDESYKNFNGDKVRKYRSGRMTDIGDIEENEWAKMARAIIDKYDEQYIFKRLKRYTREFSCYRTEKEIEMYALSIHMSRIFERPQWVCYNDWHNTNKWMED